MPVPADKTKPPVCYPPHPKNNHLLEPEYESYDNLDQFIFEIDSIIVLSPCMRGKSNTAGLKCTGRDCNQKYVTCAKFCSMPSS